MHKLFSKMLDDALNGVSLDDMEDDVKIWIAKKIHHPVEGPSIFFFYYLAKSHKKILLDWINTGKESEIFKKIRHAWLTAWSYSEERSNLFEIKSIKVTLPIEAALLLQQYNKSNRKLDNDFADKLLKSLVEGKKDETIN